MKTAHFSSIRLTWLNSSFTSPYTSFLPSNPKNGICIQKHNLTQNDGKKWSRKNIFEIPSWHFLLIHFTYQKGGCLHQMTNSVTKMAIFPHGGISTKLFLVYEDWRYGKLNYKPKFSSIFHFVLVNDGCFFHYEEF